MDLLTWDNVDELKPYPWHDVDCPGCGEPELARDITQPFTGFVCMACGCQAVVEVRPPGHVATYRPAGRRTRRFERVACEGPP